MVQAYFLRIPANYQLIITCTSHAADWQFVTISGFINRDVIFSGRGEGFPMTAPNIGTIFTCSTGALPSGDSSVGLAFAFSYAKVDQSQQDFGKGGAQSDSKHTIGPDPNSLDQIAGSITLISSEDEGGDNDNNDTVVQVTWTKIPQSVEDVANAARAAAGAATNPNVIEGVKNSEIVKGIEGLFR